MKSDPGSSGSLLTLRRRWIWALLRCRCRCCYCYGCNGSRSICLCLMLVDCHLQLKHNLPRIEFCVHHELSQEGIRKSVGTNTLTCENPVQAWEPNLWIGRIEWNFNATATQRWFKQMHIISRQDKHYIWHVHARFHLLTSWWRQIVYLVQDDVANSATPTERNETQLGFKRLDQFHAIFSAGANMFLHSWSTACWRRPKTDPAGMRTKSWTIWE